MTRRGREPLYKVSPGDVYGIYKVIRETDRGCSNTNKKVLFEVECSVCHEHFYMTRYQIAAPDMIVTHCYHHRLKGIFDDPNIRREYYQMRYRCYNPKCPMYKNYGGIGVKVCQEWLDNPKSFEIWMNEQGYTKGMSLHRIDNYPLYSPDTTQVVTRGYNSKWTRNSHIWTVNGITDTAHGWSRRLGYSNGWIQRRLLPLGYDFVQRYLQDYMDGFMTLRPRLKPLSESKQRWIHMSYAERQGEIERRKNEKETQHEC